MQSKISISVVVPIYKVQPYLKQCIDSILNQTFDDFELLLIDDESPDDCPKICDDYASRDSRIKVFHNKNGGYAYSCNFGIKHANGKYISIVDSDDFLDADMFADLYSIAEKTDSDVVKSAFWEYVDLPKVKKNKHRSQEYDIDKTDGFSVRNPQKFFLYHPSIWSCLYRRDFLIENEIYFNETGIRSWEDNPFQVKTLCLAKKVSYTKKAYYHWRKNYRFDYEKISNPLVPLTRAIEMHQWLIDNKIESIDVHACLRRRDFVYMKLALQASNLSNYKELSKLIKKYIEMPIHNEVYKSEYYKNSSMYTLGRNALFLLFAWIKIKTFVKTRLYNLFS